MSRSSSPEPAHSPTGGKAGRWRAYLLRVLVFALVFAILNAVAVLATPPDRVLAWMSPDGAPNTGYFDPSHLDNKEFWTSLSYTRYDEGTPVVQTIIQRSFFGHCAVTQQTGGETSVLTGGLLGNRTARMSQTTPGSNPIARYLNEGKAENERFTVRLSNDHRDKITSISIQGPGDAPISYIVLERSTDDHAAVETQIIETADGTTQFRTYEYDESGALRRTQDYDADGNLLSYAEYTGESNRRTATLYTADGTPAGSVETVYDLFGRLRQRNLYNINGACLQSEVFHHRFWERYGSLTGLFFLIVAVCFSLWAAGNVPVPGSPRKPKR